MFCKIFEKRLQFACIKISPGSGKTDFYLHFYIPFWNIDKIYLRHPFHFTNFLFSFEGKLSAEKSKKKKKSKKKWVTRKIDIKRGILDLVCEWKDEREEQNKIGRFIWRIFFLYYYKSLKRQHFHSERFMVGQNTNLGYRLRKQCSVTNIKKLEVFCRTRSVGRKLFN